MIEIKKSGSLTSGFFFVRGKNQPLWAKVYSILHAPTV
jgi:hypothetical protein